LCAVTSTVPEGERMRWLWHTNDLADRMLTQPCTICTASTSLFARLVAQAALRLRLICRCTASRDGASRVDQMCYADTMSLQVSALCVYFFLKSEVVVHARARIRIARFL
jgi:hypothetical protein